MGRLDAEIDDCRAELLAQRSALPPVSGRYGVEPSQCSKSYRHTPGTNAPNDDWNEQPRIAVGVVWHATSKWSIQ